MWRSPPCWTVSLHLGGFYFHIYYIVGLHTLYAGSISPILQKKLRLREADGAFQPHPSLITEVDLDPAGLILHLCCSAPRAMLDPWPVHSRLSASSHQRVTGHGWRAVHPFSLSPSVLGVLSFQILPSKQYTEYQPQFKSQIHASVSPAGDSGVAVKEIHLLRSNCLMLRCLHLTSLSLSFFFSLLYILDPPRHIGIVFEKKGNIWYLVTNCFHLQRF